MEGYDSAGLTLGRILALENCRPNYSATTLHCSSPVPCKAIPKAELYTLLHNFHESLKFVNFAKMYHQKFFLHVTNSFHALTARLSLKKTLY